MPGQQFADHRPRGQQLADPHACLHRLLAGVQTTRVRQRDHLSAGQHPGVHHRRGTRRVHRLSRGARQVHPAVAAVPVRRRGVEGSHHRRRRPQRPPQAGCVTASRERADQRRGQDRRRPSHLISSPRHRQTGQPALWTKHLLNPCKLLCAACISGLTSRVCTAAPTWGRNRMPGGPVQRRVRHRSSRQGPASPDAGRQPTQRNSQQWLL